MLCQFVLLSELPVGTTNQLATSAGQPHRSLHVWSPAPPCLPGAPQVKKTWSKNGAGFIFGLCTSAFFIMCPFLLLTGIVLTGNKHHTSTFEASPRGVWTKSCEWRYCIPCLLP